MQHEWPCVVKWHPTLQNKLHIFSSSHLQPCTKQHAALSTIPFNKKSDKKGFNEFPLSPASLENKETKPGGGRRESPVLFGAARFCSRLRDQLLFEPFGKYKAWQASSLYVKRQWEKE